MILKEYSWEFDMKCIIAMLLMTELPELWDLLEKRTSAGKVGKSVHWVKKSHGY